MIFDIVKIIRNCIKWWFVFLLTLIVGGVGIYLTYTGSKTYSISFDGEINCVNKQVIIESRDDVEYYNFLNNQVLGVVINYYLDNNIEEIAKNFKIEEEDLNIELDTYNLSNRTVLHVNINCTEKKMAEEICEYLKVDIENYAKEIADVTVPTDYKIDTNIVIYKTSEAELVRNEITNVILITLLLVVVEIFIIGFKTLKDNKFYFDHEVETEFNGEILSSDYDQNMQELITKINKDEKLSKSNLIIAENQQKLSSLIDNYDMKFIDINNSNLCGMIEDDKKIYGCAIIELVKKNTSITKINELIKVLKSRSINNICFITRNAEKKKNESTTNK